MAEPAAAPASEAVGAVERTTAASPTAEAQGGFAPAAADAEASRLSFRQWLLNGGGLYGVHGERQPSRKRSNGRKKANSHSSSSRGARHSPAGGSDASGSTLSMPNMEAREVYSGGKKKTRRWLNDLLLRELAGPLDASDVTALYAPPPWGHKTERPALERITEISPWHAERLDRALWDIILSSDMDQRDKFLRLPPHASSVDAIRGLRNKGQSGETQSGETGASGSSSASAYAAALLAWRGVTPSAKEALKRSAQWPVLARLEDKILLLKDSAEPSGAVDEANACEAPEPERPSSGAQLEGDQAVLNEERRSGAQDGSLGGERGSSEVEAAGRDEGTSDVAQPDSASSAQSRQSGSQDGSAAEDGAPAAGAQSGGGEKQDRALIFAADDAFQRLLIHGLCQFHGLASSSLTPKEARERAAAWHIEAGESDWEGAQKVVFVCLPASLDHHPGVAWVPPLKFRLSDILHGM